MKTYRSVNISASITSSQQVPHKNLFHTVIRYNNSNYRNSIPKYAHNEFSRFNDIARDSRAQIILDSGCGTGESTRHLAKANPNCLIVGVDKSETRIQKCIERTATLENIMFVRCNLIHFWRLLAQADYNVREHYLLYPNPWPKPGQLQRRWHAHPVFPIVIKLGGKITMRTNWHVYAEEFAIALRINTIATVAFRSLQIANSTSAFERKYIASGHTIYEVQSNLSCA